MSLENGLATIDLFPKALGPNSELFSENLATTSPFAKILATSFKLIFLYLIFLIFFKKNKSFSE